MSLIRDRLMTIGITFLCVTTVGVGASVLNKSHGPTIECDHYASTVVEAGTATCTEGGTSDWLVCSKCKTMLQNSHEILALGHSYKDGECIRCDMKEADDLEYQLSVDGTYYTVSGIGGFTGENLVILPKHNDLPVTGVKDEAFAHNTKLKTVEIGFGIQTIGEAAFYGCSSLQSVTVENGCQEIGYMAFSDCSNLKSVNLNVGLRKIGSYAFSGCGFTEFVVPEGVKTISDDAFTGCSKLETIAFPKSIEQIDDAFSSCGALKNVDYAGNRNAWCAVKVYSEKILDIFPQVFDPEMGE